MHHHRPSVSAIVAVFLALMASLGSATGQAEPAGATADAQATRGLRWPGASVVTGDDAAALSMNPAGMGFLRGVDVRFVHTDLLRLHGDGDGLFAASHVIGPLSLGVGFEFLPAPLISERYLRFTFGAALGFGRKLSVGLNVHRAVSDKDPWLNSLVSVDLGLMARPLPWLAIGASVQDLNTPTLRSGGAGLTPAAGALAPSLGGSAGSLGSLDGSSSTLVRPSGHINRVYELGLGFRPGSDRVLLALETRLEESTWDVDARARLEFQPVDGLVIGGDVTVSPRPPEKTIDLAIGAYMGLSFGYFGLTGGAFFSGRDSASFDGYTVGVRASTRSHRALYHPGAQAVVITLGGELPEQPSGGLLSTRRSTFTEIVLALDSLRYDPKVDAVVIKLRGLSARWAQVQELRRVFADLRRAGKKVIYHVVTPDSRELYLAAESDAIFVQPGGGLFVTGIATTSTYLRSALDELGVEAQFVAIGDYKSFPEMFTRDGPSGPATRVRDAILDGLYGQLLDGVAAGRKMDRAQLETAIDGAPYVAEGAVTAGLADRVVYDDNLKSSVSAVVGHDVTLRDDYLSPHRRDRRWGTGARVAVIPVVGSIVDGKSRRIPFLGVTFTGGESFAEACRAAAADGSVDAILVRVDSPGGSSVASQKMFRALQRAAKKKPVAVSCGGAAASGGYYLAAAAPRIFTEAGTLTGSIGIFAGKFVVGDLLAKLGVTREVHGRGQHAAYLSPYRRWTEGELAQVAERLHALYDHFVRDVAEGRKKTPAEIEPLAQGHVWLGAEAVQNGLADELGGVREALRYLNEQVGRRAEAWPELLYLPKPGLLARLGFAATVAPVDAADTADAADDGGPLLLPSFLRGAARLLAPLAGALSGGEPLALMPVRYEIE